MSFDGTQPPTQAQSNGDPRNVARAQVNSEPQADPERASAPWPTYAVLFANLALFLGITLEQRHLPSVVFIGGIAWTSAWWSSLQHEAIHGHVFRNPRTAAIVMAPSFSLWLPYSVYRTSHLRHHCDETLTDPNDDPESFYRSGIEWDELGRTRRIVLWTNRTLLGRIVIGPWLSIIGFLDEQTARIRRGEAGARRDWVTHLVLDAAILLWVGPVCGIPLWLYLFAAVWLGTSLTHLRSFAEHRWLPGSGSRTAMVQAEAPFALLFLNNNLHLAHHAQPEVRWYNLPSASRAMNADVAASAGAGLYRGYRDVASRFLVRPFCLPVHPNTVQAEVLVRALLIRS